MSNIADRLHFLNGLWPTATRWNTGSPAATAGVNLGKYDHAIFILSEGAGGAGTATITVEGSTDTSGSSVSAIGFTYRLCSTQDTWGDKTTVASTGYLLIAGANKMVRIDVDGDQLPAGYPYVRLVATVGVATAVAGTVLICVCEGAYSNDVPVTAIA